MALLTLLALYIYIYIYIYIRYRVIDVIGVIAVEVIENENQYIWIQNPARLSRNMNYAVIQVYYDFIFSKNTCQGFEMLQNNCRWFI